MRANDPVLLRRQRVGHQPLRRPQGRVPASPRCSATPAASVPNQPALPMMIDMDDPEHLRRRKLVNRGFTPDGCATASRTSARRATQIIDAVCERGECDFVCDIAAPLPMIMIGDALGVRARGPRRPAALVRRHAERPGHRGDRPSSSRPPGTPSSSTPTTPPRSSRTRRAEPDDDLMSILVARRGRRRPPRRRRDPARVAAHPHRRRRDDPPRHHAAASTSCSPHRDQWDQLGADPARSPRGGRGDAAVGDAHQEHGPHRHARRRARRASRSSEGEKLLLLYPSANRDEAVFDDPFTLRQRPHPERPRRVRLRHPLLPRRQPGPPRDLGDARRAARPAAGPRSSPSPTPIPCTARPTS